MQDLWTTFELFMNVNTHTVHHESLNSRWCINHVIVIVLLISKPLRVWISRFEYTSFGYSQLRCILLASPTHSLSATVL